MNWEAISAIGEIVGAVAVVVSLIYLASQIRTSSKATRATMYMGLHDSQAQFSYLLLSDPVLRDLVDKVDAGNSKLSPAEQKCVPHLLTMLFNKYELFFFLQREGMFSSDVDQAIARIIAKRLKIPGARAWWQNSHDKFSSDFVNWVNEKSDV